MDCSKGVLQFFQWKRKQDPNLEEDLLYDLYHTYYKKATQKCRERTRKDKRREDYNEM